MNLHEYQAKEIMAKSGLPVAAGYVCQSAEEVSSAAERLGVTPAGSACVIKAQVHAGGRGKAGGIKLAKSPSQAAEMAEKILGKALVTPQTGPQGKIVGKVYVEKACLIEREFYLALLIDRSQKRLKFIASSYGGVEIEETARSSPQQIKTLSLGLDCTLLAGEALSLGLALGLEKPQALKLSAILEKLKRMFCAQDFSLLEINPLVLTPPGEFVILDAKCAIDDSSMFRHPELQALRDDQEEDPSELRARRAGLNYIGLNGSIGCLVNGAGLAMATMDIIKQFGGEPANFLDVGGNASKEGISEGFKILLSHSGVRAILVNIFGGIVKCDLIAAGLVEAAAEQRLEVPLVVRLQGTNACLAREILANSGLKIVSASRMDEAAKLAVELAA